MSGTYSLVGVVSFSAGAIAFLILALVVSIGKRQQLSSAIMAAASILTVAWCVTEALQYDSGHPLPVLSGVLEQAQTGAWLVFLWVILSSSFDEETRQRRRPYAHYGVAAIGLALAFEIFRPVPEPFIAPVQYIMRLSMVVVGFALIENIVRNSSQDQKWSLKYLCIGLGGIFTYDLYYYADALLFIAPNAHIGVARGAVHAVVVPLLIVSTVRSESWSSRIVLSQRTAIYSTALIASGIYLVLMAISAVYIRYAGGSWGPFVQATFLFGCVVVLAVVLASGVARAHLKVVLTKHFFRYRYDYREEWVRFMATLSSTRDGSPLALRVVQSMAKPVESVGGAIWLRQSGRFSLASTWNMTATSLTDDEVASLTRFAANREWIIHIGEATEHGEGYEGLQLPDTLVHIPNIWIVVPLPHQEEILGFVALAKPRALRRLDWEDYDLLRLLARQSASYLAVQSVARQLAEARQFERFNRRATFVMHDLKNLVSQLSLVSTNMERHGDNPDFRADMTSVMADAVAKMKRLMERMHSEQEKATEIEPVSLRTLLDRLVALENQSQVEVRYHRHDEDVLVAGDRERLLAMLSHILRNAIDASGEHGWVKIGLSGEDGLAIVEVTDNGTGMDKDFIENQLFRPFLSTKKGGFGIGAYQSRQYARELGGDVEVISSRGAGTTMRVTLPMARPSAVEPDVTSVAAGGAV